MSWIVGDAIAFFDECVNRSWRPRLAFFEDVTEFVELGSGELRRSVAEARPEAFDTGFVPRMCLSMRRGSRDPDAFPCLFAGIFLIEILHKTQPTDETRIGL